MSNPIATEAVVAPRTLSQAIYNASDIGLDFECRNLIGKILTVADATFSDPIQRKAFKDVVEEKLYDHMARLRQFSFNLFTTLEEVVEGKEPNREPPTAVFTTDSDLDYRYTRKEK